MARGWKKRDHNGNKSKRKAPIEEPQIFNYRFSRDENGMYLPYCTFRFHPGFIKGALQTCLARECKYIRKIYIDQLPQPQEVQGLACIAEQS